MWETIIQGLLQEANKPTLEETRAALQSVGYDIYRTSAIDSVYNLAIQQQQTLDDYRITLVVLVVVAIVSCALCAGATAFFFEHTERGMRYISKRYQKYLEKKGVALET